MAIKPHILDFAPDEIERMILAQGYRPYRAKQVIAWIYKKLASSYDEMSDLPKELRAFLEQISVLRKLDIITLQKQKSDGSRRYLWGIGETPLAESVLLKYDYGLTGCLSTQAGCPVGCLFCASGKVGFERNLTRGEILEQFLGMCSDIGKRLTRIVFMGTGEPFFNYDAVLSAIEALCDKESYDMSRRRITVSTVGIPGEIRRFAQDSNGVRLAVSLHGATDKVRDKLIPVNRVYPLKELMSAVRHFTNVTGHRVTFEYILLKGVNDSKEDAKQLANLVNNIDCLVNIITWNPILGVDLEGSGPRESFDFRKILEGNRIKVTTRRRLGGNIKAACGQLRRVTT